MKDPFVPAFVGTPVERLEDLRLLRGKGQYVDDLHREGMLHAAILRSTVAHGRIRSIDIAGARALPGVRGIFTAEDIAQSSNGSVPTVPQRLTAVCMEPRGLLAVWDGAKTKLTVSGAAKIPFSTRRMLARQMDLPEECVDMIEPDVGGGFGVRGEFYPEDYLIPFAARKLGRPVKWTEDRRENLLASNHSREMDCEIEIACERNGTILALRGTAWVDMGAYMRANGSIPPRNFAQFLFVPYRVPIIHEPSLAL